MPTAFTHDPNMGVPSSTTNTGIVRWSGTTGGTLLSSGVTIDNSNVMAGITSLTVDNININGNTISSTAGTDLLITPLGGQQIVLDGTIIIDAGVVTGATSITSTEFYGGGGNLTGISASAFPYSSATVASIEATTSTHNDRIPAMYVTANDSGDMVDGFGPQIIFRATDSGATNSILGQMSFERNGADNSGKFRLQSKVAGADNTLMVIHSTGEMQLPDQPAFLARVTSHINNETGDGTVYTIAFGTEVFDQNGDWDGSTTFTAPVTGRYRFSVKVDLTGLASGHTDGYFNVITTNRIHRCFFNPYGNLASGQNIASHMWSALVDMDATNTATVTVSVNGGSKVVDVGGDSNLMTSFSGELVA